MPNHFHFLINSTKDSVLEKKVGGLAVLALNDVFRQLLNSYAQAINKQEGISGSLFRQKTKIKLLEKTDERYPFICFNYIHQNPLNAGLVEKMEDWEFSSFQDYSGSRNGKLCDKSLAFDLLGVSKENFYQESYQVIPSENCFNADSEYTKPSIFKKKAFLIAQATRKLISPLLQPRKVGYTS